MISVVLIIQVYSLARHSQVRNVEEVGGRRDLRSLMSIANKAKVRYLIGLLFCRCVIKRSAVSATPENMDKYNRCRSFRPQYTITIYMTALSDCPFRCRSFRALFNCMIVNNITSVRRIPWMHLRYLYFTEKLMRY